MVTPLPFELFLTAIGISTLIGLIGIIMGLKKIDGAPIVTIFAGIILFGLIASAPPITNIGGNSTETIRYSVSHPMNVTTSDNSVAFSATVTAQAERPANVNSLLVNAHISCIEVNMLRTGSPTDNVMIGIGDNDARVVKLFGNITASTINTASRSYQVCLGNHDYWILAYNDYIIIKHTGSSGANNIAVNNLTTNPFDGTNSVRSTYTSGLWGDSTTQDLRMKLTSEDMAILDVAQPYTITDNNIWIYLIAGASFWILLGVIIFVQKW